MAEDHEIVSIASVAPYPRPDPEKSTERLPKIYEAMGKGNKGSKGSKGSKGKKTVIQVPIAYHHNSDLSHKITANLLIITFLIIFVIIQTFF